MLYLEYLPDSSSQSWMKYRVGQPLDDQQRRAVIESLQSHWSVRQSWRLVHCHSDAPEFAILLPNLPWIEAWFEVSLAKRIADALGEDEFQLLVHRRDGGQYPSQTFRREGETTRYRRVKVGRSTTEKVA